jgi:hypothetical protein
VWLGLDIQFLAKGYPLSGGASFWHVCSSEDFTVVSVRVRVSYTHSADTTVE